MNWWIVKWMAAWQASPLGCCCWTGRWCCWYLWCAVVANVASMLCILCSLPAFDISLIAFLLMLLSLLLLLLIFLHASLAFNKNCWIISRQQQQASPSATALAAAAALKGSIHFDVCKKKAYCEFCVTWFAWCAYDNVDRDADDAWQKQLA